MRVVFAFILLISLALAFPLEKERLVRDELDRPRYNEPDGPLYDEPDRPLYDEPDRPLYDEPDRPLYDENEPDEQHLINPGDENVNIY